MGKNGKLIVVLGDQLSRELAAFDDFDAERDAVWMAEVYGESKYVWSSKQRTALFLSAMRHFRDELRESGVTVHYQELEDGEEGQGLGECLKAFLAKSKFRTVRMTQPGEHRLVEVFEEICETSACRLELCPDNSFLCSDDEFKVFLKERKAPRMEYFYRQMRKRHKILMEGDEPEGGQWNFDASNRKSFGSEGPESLMSRPRFKADKTTKAVIDLVNDYFEDHPGTLNEWVWPTSRAEALRALENFIENELLLFGKYQDAMWSGEPFLYHSLLSSSINLRMLWPREVIHLAEQAYRKGDAPLESVEGFIRQILGWREYVRGIYWAYMPDYLEKNALQAKGELPQFYWTGETDMRCLREAIGQTLKYGYAHHIQRLMVTGLYGLLRGVSPKAMHEWYLAVYVDAVEWVELPNTLGMSQFADGGLMGSKPYVATGKYIDRMSNYCGNCPYDPKKRTGEDACPFTTLYWNFLDKHREKLSGNPRMALQVRNLKRIKKGEMQAIRERAEALLSE